MLQKICKFFGLNETKGYQKKVLLTLLAKNFNQLMRHIVR